jgi:hypothetical protein
VLTAYCSCSRKAFFRVYFSIQNAPECIILFPNFKFFPGLNPGPLAGGATSPCIHPQHGLDLAVHGGASRPQLRGPKMKSELDPTMLETDRPLYFQGVLTPECYFVQTRRHNAPPCSKPRCLSHCACKSVWPSNLQRLARKR